MASAVEGDTVNSQIERISTPRKLTSELADRLREQILSGQPSTVASVATKGRGRLDHDPYWQELADKAAKAIQRETGKWPSKRQAAKRMRSDSQNIDWPDEETIVRRIRKTWT